MENIVYSTEYCPYCSRVKALLREHGVEFQDIMLSSREQIQEIKDKYNWRTVPVVILNGQFIGGFDDTNALVQAGKLDQILGRK